MKKVSSSKHVKCALCLMAVLCMLEPAWAGIYQHGTVVRMRMVDCLPAHHGFISVMGGAPAQMTQDVCPEYTLLSEKVVYVIVGRSSDQLVPLADIVDFRINKNELAMRIDDARHESKFSIKEMILRSEWDMVQKHMADQMKSVRSSDRSLSIENQD